MTAAETEPPHHTWQHDDVASVAKCQRCGITVSDEALIDWPDMQRAMAEPTCDPVHHNANLTARTVTDQDILRVRMEAAELERTAAEIRLQTAHEEQESARRTLRMADLVADSMMRREGVQS